MHLWIQSPSQLCFKTENNTERYCPFYFLPFSLFTLEEDQWLSKDSVCIHINRKIKHTGIGSALSFHFWTLITISGQNVPFAFCLKNNWMCYSPNSRAKAGIIMAEKWLRKREESNWTLCISSHSKGICYIYAGNSRENCKLIFRKNQKQIHDILNKWAYKN